MLRLSIIVPVFNVEQYLEKCLDSLLNQDISCEEYEIICINDGSTDKCGEILQAYALGHKNIRVINQANTGLGGARNTGIKNANGNYIMFADSDDYIESNSLNSILENAENNKLDILRYNYKDVDTDYNVIPKSRNDVHAAVYDNEIVNGKVFLSEKLGWACYVCVFLFRTSLLKNTGLLFADIYYEDTEWLPKVLIRAERVSSVNRQIYNYLKRPGSITKADDKARVQKKINDKIKIIEGLEKQSISSGDKRLKKWFSGMISHIVISILSVTQKKIPEEKNKIIKQLREKKLFPLGAYRFTARQIVHVCLINLSPYLYCYIKKHRF